MPVGHLSPVVLHLVYTQEHCNSHLLCQPNRLLLTVGRKRCIKVKPNSLRYFVVNYFCSFCKNGSISFMATIHRLFQHLLHSFWKNENNVFSITLLLGLREVLQDLFLESALVYFLSNTKFFKMLFIQLSKIHKLEIKDTVLHRSFDRTGELNKGSSLLILLIIGIHQILEIDLSSWNYGDFEAQACRSGDIFLQWQLGHRQKSLQAGLSCKPVAIRPQLKRYCLCQFLRVPTCYLLVHYFHLTVLMAIFPYSQSVKPQKIVFCLVHAVNMTCARGAQQKLKVFWMQIARKNVTPLSGLSLSGQKNDLSCLAIFLHGCLELEEKNGFLVSKTHFFLHGGSAVFFFFVFFFSLFFWGGWGGVGVVMSGPATETYSSQTLDLSMFQQPAPT